MASEIDSRIHGAGYLLFLFLLRSVSCSAEPTILDKLEDTARVAHSGVKIAQATHTVGEHIRSTIWPSKAEQLEQAQREKILEILKTEEALNQCLITNALTTERVGNLPSECREATRLFASVAGYEALNSVKKEFNETRDEIVESQKEEAAPQGMSTRTKLLIGGTAAAAGGVLFVIAAPVLFPGTLIAAKAIAIKTAAGSVIGYISTANTNQIVTAAAHGALSIAKDAKDSTIEAAQAGAHDFMNLSLSDQIIVTARIIEAIESAAHHTQPSLYTTESEELQHLLRVRANRPSLRERIRHAQRNSV